MPWTIAVRVADAVSGWRDQTGEWHVVEVAADSENDAALVAQQIAVAAPPPWAADRHPQITGLDILEAPR